MRDSVPMRHARRMHVFFFTAAMATMLLAAPLLSAQDEPKKQEKAYFWFRIWPDFHVKYDIEKDEVVAKVQNKHGIAHGTDLSHDRRKLFVTTGQRKVVEVLDLATATIIEEHDFDELGYVNRVADIKEIPGGTHWYVKLDRIKRNLDHYVVEKPQWLHYEVATKKILERMKELPKPIRRGARISPCGTKWHVFRGDITIIDPETLKEEGKIELSRPLYSGMGPISVRGEDFYDNKNHDAYRMMYSMRDPVKRNRSLIGIVDIDIKGRKIAGLREWGPDPRVWGFRLTRDRKLAIGQKRGYNRNRDVQDPDTVFVTYDIEKGEKLRETRTVVRNGLGMSGISPDGKKIYLSGRGHELVIFDGDHQYSKTVVLDGETDGRFITVVE